MILVIKGTVDDAERKAREHGVTLENPEERTNARGAAEVTAKAPPNEWREVFTWFHEDALDDLPFADGSLLYYHYEAHEG